MNPVHPNPRQPLPYWLLSLVFVLPFLIFGWMLPFVGRLTIGNDYLVYSIFNQLEIQFSLAHGQFPLFVPGVTGGAPVSTLTLGQLYHPLPYLAALSPGYWTGLALDWNTFWRLVSLGISHLLVFVFLVRLCLKPYLAFAISLITVYNLRMLDLFRYGASFEAYTAMLILCVSLAWTVLQPRRLTGPAGIVAATYLLLVSGHPQMAYYGLITALMMWLAAPYLVRALVPAAQRPEVSIPGFYLTTGACLLGGSALASIYILPFAAEFLAENAERVGQTYAWSTAHSESWYGSLSNFFWPFWSDVHAGFGGSVLPLFGL
ncbi:MAG: hypothetical protein GY794_22475, partial [bacterium]|nr:hypothetical protein [bacterium]